MEYYFYFQLADKGTKVQGDLGLVECHPNQWNSE